MEKFECLSCGTFYPADVFHYFCPRCGDPLLVASAKRGRTFRLERRSSLEAFQDYLPVTRIDPSLSLGEGWTPLVKMNRLAESLNFSSLFAKNECQNPTHSFKDRGTAVVFQKARSLGIKAVGTVSTGNMASSTAAYGGRAGVATCIFLKEGTPVEKILSTGVHGSHLFLVRGDYGNIFRQSLSLGRKLGIYFANSVDPYRIEGYKVASLEIFLQLDRRLPQFVLVPVSSGGHLIGLMRGFLDLKRDGLADRMPVFVGVQAQGCSPLARAFARGRETWTTFKNAATIAHAISNPSPPGGRLALKYIRENGGLMLGVSDAEILKAQRELAALEGIFCDPASATTLAGLKKLVKIKLARPRDVVVAVITGSGLKSMETLKEHRIPVHKTTVAKLESAVRSVFPES
jgi:threonine synthase